MVNILIVEDQWLLSSAVEEAVLSLGHEAIGTATTAKEAYELADKAEVAFVDVNLIDGATGPEICVSAWNKGSDSLLMKSSAG